MFKYINVTLVECAECRRVIVYSNPMGDSNLVTLERGCKFCATPSFMKLMKIPSNIEMINLNLLVLDVLKEWTEDAKSYPCLYMGFAEYSKLASETSNEEGGGGSSKDSSKDDVNFNPFSFNAPTQRVGDIDGASSMMDPASSISGAPSLDKQEAGVMDIKSRIALKPVFAVLQGPYLYLYDLQRQSGKLKYKVKNRYIYHIFTTSSIFTCITI